MNWWTAYEQNLMANIILAVSGTTLSTSIACAGILQINGHFGLCTTENSVIFRKTTTWGRITLSWSKNTRSALLSLTEENPLKNGGTFYLRGLSMYLREVAFLHDLDRDNWSKCHMGISQMIIFVFQWYSPCFWLVAHNGITDLTHAMDFA